MTPRVARFLKRTEVAHIVRAAAAITTQRVFVLVGTGAVIAQVKDMPLEMMRTRELDIQVPDDEAGRRTADLIDGSIGEGSQFDATFGYYAHAIPEGTAQLPTGWRERAKPLKLEPMADVTCLCPDVNDIALSKVVAWREKDQEWLRAAASRILSLPKMMERLAQLPDGAVTETEMRRRMDVVQAFSGQLNSG